MIFVKFCKIIQTKYLQTNKFILYFKYRKVKERGEKCYQKMIYKQAYKDITNAYFNGVFDTKEWIKRWQAIIADFEKEYGKDTTLNLGE